MFSTPNNNETSKNTVVSTANDDLPKKLNTFFPHDSQNTQGMQYSAIDSMLEKEKQQNKSESWNKLDKTAKIQKLHAFAEKYGKENSLPVKEVKNLKAFFVESLDKGKLQKTKDVVYDKDSREIDSIPALHFNTEKHNFTLRILDTKRVSTLKSLTPKRATEVNIASIQSNDL